MGLAGPVLAGPFAARHQTLVRHLANGKLVPLISSGIRKQNKTK